MAVLDILSRLSRLSLSPIVVDIFFPRSTEEQQHWFTAREPTPVTSILSSTFHLKKRLSYYFIASGFDVLSFCAKRRDDNATTDGPTEVRGFLRRSRHRGGLECDCRQLFEIRRLCSDRVRRDASTGTNTNRFHYITTATTDPQLFLFLINYYLT